MRALGVHTFFVGFQRGIEEQPDLECLGSVEGWYPGVRARALCKPPASTLAFDEKLPEAELVFSNPPCSRFSTLSTSTFSEEAKTQLGKFCELEASAVLAAKQGARAFWWETGPLCWTRGDSMVEAVHEMLKARWGECTTVTALVDARYCGLPQRRPRTHVIHVAGHREPPEPPPPEKLPAGGLLEFLRSKGVEPTKPETLTFEYPLSPWGARKRLIREREIGNFASMAPVAFAPDAPYALTVLSGRRFSWADEPGGLLDRDWSLEEYAVVAGYSVEDAKAALEGEGKVATAVRLMSKSVSRNVAGWVWRNVVKPTMESEGLGDYEMWRVKCSVKDVKSPVADWSRKPIGGIDHF